VEALRKALAHPRTVVKALELAGRLTGELRPPAPRQFRPELRPLTVSPLGTAPARATGDAPEAVCASSGQSLNAVTQAALVRYLDAEERRSTKK
jgi:hypothetical protein